MGSYVDRLLGEYTDRCQVRNALYNSQLMCILSEWNIEENVGVVVSSQDMSADAEPCLLKRTCAAHQANGDTWSLQPDRV